MMLKTEMMKMTSLTGLGLLILLFPLAAQEPGKKPAESGDRAAQEYNQALEATAVAQEVQEVKKQDSLRRLIHDLDTGSTSDRSSSAFKAYSSLRSLGSLMVPALLAELDDMGPFGLMNASKLLTSYPDKSLGALVERYLKDPSPARQEMAAGLLSRLAPETRRKLYPLALASKRDKVRLAGLHSMMGLGIEDDLVMKEILRVYKEGRTPTKTSLIYLVGGQDLSKSALGRAFLQTAMTDPYAGVRPAAFDVFVQAATDQEEDQALALIAKLDKSDRESFLELALSENKRWPRVLIAALEFPRLSDGVRRVLDRMAIRLSAEQIGSLLSSENQNLVRFALKRLLARQELVARMDALLGLLDHPDSSIRRNARELLVGHGPLLLLESGRFEDLVRLGGRFRDQVRVLERAPSGRWPKEMFLAWKEMERYEAENPGTSNANDKGRLARLMSRELEDRDWSLVEEFLRTAYQDPMIDRSGSGWFNRTHLVERLLKASYLTNALQCKAILLTADTTGNIAETIFNRISEQLVDGEVRPEFEAALFQLIAECSGKADASQQGSKRYAYPRDEILNSAFQLLSQLPNSDRDGELMDLLKSPDYNLAEGAKHALLERSKDRIPVFGAILASPHAARLLSRSLSQPELAKDANLREAVIGKLLSGMIVKVDPDALEEWLQNVDRDKRVQILVKLLHQVQERQDPDTTKTLLAALGEYKDAQHLSVFARYLGGRDEDVRRQAIEAIGQTFSPKAAPYLLEALKDEENAEVARAYLQRIDEYLDEKEKWEDRFSERKPSTPGPAGPGKPRK